MKRIAILFSIALLLAGCKSGDPAPTAPTPPVINSISPTSGLFNTEVTISGTGFSATLAGNQATVNGKSAEITSATATTLVIKVPLRAGKGKVAVTTTSGTATGPDFDFLYTVTVSTLAGQAGSAGYVNGAANVSKFILPTEIKVGPDGNIYVSDRLNHCIRKVTPGGITSTYTGQNNNPGSTNGDISLATYQGPNGICFDKNGTAYLADVSQSNIRKITAGGIVSAFSGIGPVGGYQDGLAAQSVYNVPEDCVADQNLNVFVTEFGNHTIRKLDPSGNSVTLAGNGTPGFADGTGTAALFYSPVGIILSATGDLIVADQGNDRIRKVTTAGVVTTIAGGDFGFVDGPGASAKFYNPRDLAIDSDGNIFVADVSNHAIRIITTSGNVVTLAGDGTTGSVDGSGNAARFNSPYALDIDANGVLYIADTQNYLIRKMIVQ